MVSRLLIIFMIVLLPLRSWAGDLMSVQMATSGMTGALVSNEMPADCPMLAAASSSQSTDDSTQLPAGMGCCASCELCTPLAELADISVSIVTFAAHAKPLLAGVEFISAPVAPSFKPPIS